MKKRIKKFAENYTISQFDDDYVGLQIRDEKMSVIYEAIAVRLTHNKKVQNLNDMWYRDLAKHLATQGDFGRESS